MPHSSVLSMSPSLRKSKPKNLKHTMDESIIEELSDYEGVREEEMEDID